MGPLYGLRGLQAGVERISSTALLNLERPKGPRQKKVLSIGLRSSVIPRGNQRAASGRTRFGVLFQSLHRPQTKRGCKTHPGPQGLKQVPKGPIIPDGIDQVSGGLPARRGTTSVHRYKGRILARSYLSRPSEAASLRGKSAPLPVRGLTFWSGHRSSCFHESIGSTVSLSKVSRHIHSSLSRRPIGSRPVSGRSKLSGTQNRKISGIHGLGSQPGQVSLNACAKARIFGSTHRHKAKKGLPAPKEVRGFKRTSSTSQSKASASHSPLYEVTGKDGSLVRGRPICAVPLKGASTCHSVRLEQKGSSLGSPYVSLPVSPAEPLLVAGSPEPAKGEVLCSRDMAGCDHGRQSARLGCSPGRFVSPGEMVSLREVSTHKSAGNSSSLSSPVSLVRQVEGSSGQGSIRQCHCRGIHKSPGGHKKSCSPKRGESNPDLGREICPMHICSVHSGNRQLASRLPKPPTGASGGMDSSPRHLPEHLSEVGNTRCRSLCIEVQCKGGQLSVPDKGSTCLRHGCTGVPMGPVLPNVCVSSAAIITPSSSQGKVGRKTSDSGGSSVAQKGLVRGHCKDVRGATVVPSASAGPIVPGANIPSFLTVSQFDGLAIESHILKKRGLSNAVASTLINARKPASRLIYYRVWKSYVAWCETRGWHPRRYLVGRILEFLQLGADMKLALSTIKGQISALSIFFQRPLATHSLIKTFLQGVIRLSPPVKIPLCPWDLNLVLSVLQKQPFEPLAHIPLVLLTRKVIFLVAITSARRVSELAALSCKEPYLIFHKDRVVLRPHPAFLPKVVSKFHLNQDLVLPSFFSEPSSAREKSLHTLDVLRAVKIYLKATAQVRKTDTLFILPEGPRCGQAASKSTISKWIRQVITQAYGLRGKVPPFKVKAHSTRAVGTSWAVHHQASMAQVCKAATWSSVHTFTKFYQLDIRKNEESAFGRSVLQAAV